MKSPGNIVVYADSNTRMLTQRHRRHRQQASFEWPDFKDNGTLRKDCAQVDDGVPDPSLSTNKIIAMAGKSGSAIAPQSLSKRNSKATFALRPPPNPPLNEGNDRAGTDFARAL